MSKNLGNNPNRQPRKNPPVAATTEGHTDALQTNGGSTYSGKRDLIKDAYFRGNGGRHSTLTASCQQRGQKVTFRTPEGLHWSFGGKKGRVLSMLASGQGVTQWDCNPWHTRLGGTIHAMREVGLSIETQLVGPYRHARYFLRTVGIAEHDRAA